MQLFDWFFTTLNSLHMTQESRHQQFIFLHKCVTSLFNAMAKSSRVALSGCHSLDIMLITHETDNSVSLNQCVTGDGTSLRCNGKLVEDFPFHQQPAKRIPMGVPPSIKLSASTLETSWLYFLYICCPNRIKSINKYFKNNIKFS